MIFINDNDVCECGAYKCDDGYCCNGHNLNKENQNE